MNTELDQFTRAYIEAAYFTDTGDIGQPDADAELSTAATERAAADCAKFQIVAHAELVAACMLYGYDRGQAGHDFWLTRNHHGIGFWDRDVLLETLHGERFNLGERLTTLAHRAGECHLYAGDDGLLYFG